MASIIKLDNGLEFVVIAKLTLKGENYLYLSTKGEEKTFIFAKLCSGQNLDPVEDDQTVLELLSELGKQIEKK